MTDEQQKVWDLRIKIFGALGFIITTVWGVYQFNTNLHEARANELKARSQELEAPLYDMRLRLYTEACRNLQVLAEEPSSSAPWLSARKRLNVLHWAELPIIEGKGFSKKMLEVMNLVRNLEPGVPVNDAETERINKLAIGLAKTARSELGSGFNGILNE